jgi:hypothetical protein
MCYYLGRSLKLRVSYKEKSAEVIVVESNEPITEIGKSHNSTKDRTLNVSNSIESLVRDSFILSETRDYNVTKMKK